MQSLLANAAFFRISCIPKLFVPPEFQELKCPPWIKYLKPCNAYFEISGNWEVHQEGAHLKI